MDGTSLLGIAAGIFTTASILPQIKKAWDTQKVDDLSPWWLGVLILGVALWTIYGIIEKDMPLIVTNGTAVVLNSFLMVLYFRYMGE